MKRFQSRSRLRSIALLVAVLLGCTTAVSAAPAAIPHGTLELIAEKQSIQPGQSFTVGLHFHLEPGWHIYWINPGDSGQPPRVVWKLPPGVTAGEIEWPAPGRLGTASIVDYGYKDDVTLLVPMRATAGIVLESAHLAAEVKVLVCREMCIPGKTQLALSLPVKAERPAADAQTSALFSAARRLLPKPTPPSWKFHVDEDKESFALVADMGERVAEAAFFPLADSEIDNAAPQKFSSTAGGFRLTLRKSERLLKPIERLNGVLEVGAGRAYLVNAAVGKLRAAEADGGTGFQPVKSLQEGLRK